MIHKCSLPSCKNLCEAEFCSSGCLDQFYNPKTEQKYEESVPEEFVLPPPPYFPKEMKVEPSISFEIQYKSIIFFISGLIIGLTIGYIMLYLNTLPS